MPIKKETNPKDAVGIKKVPLSTVSSAVMMEIGLGMLEGACKYGRHNYRKSGVRTSVYYDAVMRHMMSFWEGQDIDEESGLSHVTKAMSCLAVMRDAMLNDMITDDRPPKLKNQNFIVELNAKAEAILKKYPKPVPAFTELEHGKTKKHK